jgi:cell volume regulation protein A
MKMNITGLFALLGGLLVLAFVANRQFRRTRVPDVVVLMLVGLMLGPLSGWVEARQFQQVTHAFGTLALILILFEGGLEINLRETLRHFPGGLVLGFMTYLLSFFLIGTVVWWSQQLSWTSALLVGAVLGCTSSSIVFPVLQQMELRNPVKVPLLLEASLGDVLAVLSVKVLLDFVRSGGPVFSSLVGGFVSKTVLSLLLALLAGVLWSRLLPMLSERRFWNVLTFSIVLLLYAGAEAVGGSGLFAVLGFGLTLANYPGIDPHMVQTAIGLEIPAGNHHLKVLTFHSELAFLVRTFFFVLLGVVVEFAGLRGYLLPALGALGALFLARWLALKASGWAWKGIEPAERELILWMMPRGLITAVLSIQVFEGRGGAEFTFLPALAFAVILATNLIVVFGSIRAARGVRGGETEPPSTPAPSAAYEA